MLKLSKYSTDKLLLTCDKKERKEHESNARRLGGVWIDSVSGWVFHKNKETEINTLMLAQDTEIQENYDWVLKSPKMITKSPSNSTQEDINNELFALIGDLNDRICELEHFLSTAKEF